MSIKFYSAALLAALATVTASTAHADISGFGGFAPTNGSAVNNGSSLTLTSDGGGQAGSAFNSTVQDITQGFDTSFLYTVGGARQADGLTFTLQNDPRGTAALGGGGGSLGYSAGGGATAITNSVAIGLNFFNFGGFTPTNNTQLGTNGTFNTPVAIGGGVTLYNGTPVNVHLAYNGTTLTETLAQDSGNGNGNYFITTYNTGNLQTVLGGRTAYVGFTGADGGLTSAQSVSNFAFLQGGNLAAPGDPIVAETSNNTPNGEGVANAIDGNPGTKYLNFNGAGSGFIVTPSIGPSFATGISLTAANDSADRDPTSYAIYGSNDTTDAIGSSADLASFKQISTGTVSGFSSRFSTQDISFATTGAYSQYEILFPTNGGAGIFQIADAELIGSAPEPSQMATLSLIGLGLGGLLLRARKRLAAGASVSEATS